MKIIDISNVNGPVGWKRVRLSGVTGVWLKATEGKTWNDPVYLSNRKGAHSALLRVGAYHFARPDNNSPEDEAEHFSNVIGKIGINDLKPVLDLETKGSKDLEQWARDFNKKFEELRGIWPAFYSYSYFIKQMSPKTTIGNGLWLADYGANDGKRHTISVPAPWEHYIAHQYTSRGKVLGVNGYVDISYAPKITGVLAYPKGGL